LYLVGLPPTVEEVDAFLADSSPDAFARAWWIGCSIRRDSASIGGGNWLDVARYRRFQWIGKHNAPFPNAWRYRDYVIRAFNSEMPFNQFIREQLAGDLLPAANDEERYEKLTATGFLVLGPKVLAEPDREKLIMDVADEQIDVTQPRVSRVDGQLRPLP